MANDFRCFRRFDRFENPPFLLSFSLPSSSPCHFPHFLNLLVRNRAQEPGNRPDSETGERAGWDLEGGLRAFLTP